MIRFRDAAIIAYTKLRTHRVRTWITVGLAGLMFGLVLTIAIFTKGAFDSVAQYEKTGLNNRSIVAVTAWTDLSYYVFDHSYDKEFIAAVEQAHTDFIAKKTAAAKKFDIEYDPKTQDPSPVILDQDGKKNVDTSQSDSALVLQVVKDIKAKDTFSINDYLKEYASANVIDEQIKVVPASGDLMFMKDGKERVFDENAAKTEPSPSELTTSPTSMQLLGASVTEPFITEKFDPTKGEIPALVPYLAAESALGYKPLKANAPAADKVQRLKEVRSRVGEVTASLCYRNAASKQIISEATMQREALKTKDKPGYEPPLVTLALPKDDSCGAVVTTKDASTIVEKQQADNQIKYQKEIGEYSGDPVQYKIILRGVGIDGSTLSLEQGAVTIDQTVQSLLQVPLSYDSWIIPTQLLDKVPVEKQPGKLLTVAENKQSNQETAYLVEFQDKSEARKFLNSMMIAPSADSYSSVGAIPFGSAALLLDEMKVYIDGALLWMVIVVGAIAVIIMFGLIGRTIADSRKESAVFRAIGARRIDIASIYGIYALLLSLRIIIFAGVLALVLLIFANVLLSDQATSGAQLAYSVTENPARVHFFGFSSVYLPLIAVAIVTAGLLASIIPILRNMRRSPIRDMRED